MTEDTDPIGWAEATPTPVEGDRWTLADAWHLAIFPGRFPEEEGNKPPTLTLQTLWVTGHDIALDGAESLIFDNHCPTSGIGITLRDPVTFTMDPDGTYVLGSVNVYGIVLETLVHGEMGAGLHYHLIPWSNIISLHQWFADE